MVRRDQQQRTVQQGQPPRIDEAPLRTIDIQRAVSSENPFPGGEANPGPVVEAPQTIGTTFQTISLQDQAFDLGQFSIPPDTMGAVGPSHFLEVINSSVAIYAKTGSRLSHVKLDTFFTLTIGATTYPRNGSFDPRVLYDRRSGRFFATAMERGSPSQEQNGIILAVSRTSDATGLWDKYFINRAQPRLHSLMLYSKPPSGLWDWIFRVNAPV